MAENEDVFGEDIDEELANELEGDAEENRLGSLDELDDED